MGAATGWAAEGCMAMAPPAKSPLARNAFVIILMMGVVQLSMEV